MGDTRGDQPFLLSTTPPTRRQERLAIGVVVLLIGALLATAPLARVPLPNTEGLLPAYAAAVLVIELVTAAMLLALFTVQPARSILVLAAGYLFSGLMVVPWALSFPGVLAALNLDLGLQSTASIAAMRRLGFPLAVLAYVLLKDGRHALPSSPGSVRRAILLTIATVAATTLLATWLILANDDALPPFMQDARSVTASWHYVSVTAVGLYLAVLALLWRRRRSVLDLWLMVVLATLLIEIVLLSYLSAGLRLSLGWWGGRLYGLASASTVLIVLLAETTKLYARLAVSLVAERRAREARLTAMQALSASIAHEVNQPLASMVTNADAALRWLAKDRPDILETRAALRRIVGDGHRAGKVIDSIRTMFKTGARERVPLAINDIIATSLERVQSELRVARIAAQVDLAQHLPHVIGNPDQLSHVMHNLLTNAIDALGAVPDRQRVLRVTSCPGDSGGVLVAIADSGSGIASADRQRIFEPFVSTKADGMGMGLMVCRSIIEAHGGKLWAADNLPHGAVLSFALPGEHPGVLSPLPMSQPPKSPQP